MLITVVKHRFKNKSVTKIQVIRHNKWTEAALKNSSLLPEKRCNYQLSLWWALTENCTNLSDQVIVIQFIIKLKLITSQVCQKKVI